MLIRVTASPYVTEEISRVDVAIFLQKVSITTAAIHHIGVELTFQFSFRLSQNTWEIRDFC